MSSFREKSRFTPVNDLEKVQRTETQRINPIPVLLLPHHWSTFTQVSYSLDGTRSVNLCNGHDG